MGKYGIVLGMRVGLAGDFRLATRQLGQRKLFALSVIALLGAGLGANVAVFSLVDALLLKPLPVRDPAPLVRLITTQPPLGPRSEFAFEEYEAWRKNATSIKDLMAWCEQDHFVRVGGSTERLRIHLVSDNFFAALGVRPALGRLFAGASEGSPTPAVLSYAYWQRRFGGSLDVIGQAIVIGGHPFVVAGVAPRGFNGLTVETGPDLRIPVSTYKLWPRFAYEGRIECSVVGRLKPGVAIAAARIEAETIWKNTAKALYPDAALGQFDLEPAWRGVSSMRTQFSRVLWLLMGSLGLLLVMVCANVAGLLMARTASRQGELAVRVALGATRASLVRHLLAESALLLLAGAAGAFVVAALLIPQLTAMLPPVRDLAATRLPLSLEVALDWRALGFAISASVIAMLLFGLAPALMAVRRDVHPLLKEARAPGGWTGRQLVVVAQTAIATLLLIGAGLTLATIRGLERMDAGFRRDSRIVTFSLDPDMADYSREQGLSLQRRLLDAARALPGTEAVGAASRGLMRGTGIKMTVVLPGQRATQADFLNTSLNAVSPGYFETMGIPLIAGRSFTEADETPPPKSPGPAPRIVNETFMRKFFGGRNALGRTFGSASLNKDPAKPHFQVVGVVADARYRSLREPIQPTSYTLLDGRGGFIVHVRTTAPEATVTAGMREQLARIDPRLSFIEVTTLAGEIEASLWAERVAAILTRALAMAAALVAGAGIYSLLAFAVEHRRREIGIRTALGARRIDVVWLIAGRAVLLAGSGALIGIVAGRWAGGWIASLLYGVQPGHMGIGAAAMACIVLVAVLGALGPTLRATRVEPSQVLREQ